MTLSLSPAAARAIERLEEAGFEAYAVGGAVRDFLLGADCQDTDLTTNATLLQIEHIFRDCKITRYKKGHTLGIVLNHTYLEISSFDGNTLLEDLANRDFTINAMAYHPSKGIIDPYDGRKALQDGRIQTIKEPLEVITKDPIRILRAIRFAGALGFTLDSRLKDCILAYCDLLKRVCPKRYRKEIDSILLLDKPSIVLREYLPVFGVVFPALKKTQGFLQHTRWHHLDVFEHILCVVDTVRPILILRLAALFHDIEKPQCFTMDEEGVGHFYQHYALSAQTAKAYMTQLGYSEELIGRVYRLVYYHDRQIPLNQKGILHFLHDFKDKDLSYLFELKRADICGQNPELLYRLQDIDRLAELTAEVLAKKEAFTIHQLNIQGNQLKSLGFAGEEIGDTLNEMLELVMDNRLDNSLPALIEYAKNRKR